MNSLITPIQLYFKSFTLLNPPYLIFNLPLQPILNHSYLLLKLATRLLLHLLTSKSLLIMSLILFLSRKKIIFLKVLFLLTLVFYVLYSNLKTIRFQTNSLTDEFLRTHPFFKANVPFIHDSYHI